MLEIFQSYSDEVSEVHLTRTATPLNYSKLPPGTEYDLFKFIFSNKLTSEDYWGCLSWKFNVKSPVDLETFSHFCKSEIESGKDCIFINPMIANEAVFATAWEQGNLVGHHGMGVIYEYLVKNGVLHDIKIVSSKNFSFCNYFVANNYFWKIYFNYIDQVLEFLEREVRADTLIGRLYSGSANYEKNKNLSMKPFIVERLFTNFMLENSNLKFSSYIKTRENYIQKLGKVTGLFCYELSKLKQQAIENTDLVLLETWIERRKIPLYDRRILHNFLYSDDPFIELLS